MTLRLYNTASRTKETFEPLDPPRVLFYNCGPTVYDHFHIGNARNFVVMDVVRRHLRRRGYQVKFVQNITDIDDKIINRAKAEGVSSEEIASRYTEYFMEKTRLLGIETPDVCPRATEHIPQIIGLIERLIGKGLAYATPSGDVYFRVRGFDRYGELSGRNVDDLRQGARVEPGEEKEDPLDFALWKASKPGEPTWESPWGPGRPGWHIECTAMIHTHLGETIDIHAGGSDLVFPHHENERAQSMGATGKEYVRFWLHNGFLNIEGQKMSKSLGNFRTIEDVLREYSPLTVRYFLLSAHYRSPLDFSRENLDAAAAAVRRLSDCLTATEQLLRALAVEEGGAPPLEDVVARYDEAMDDDFNTARALGVIFELAGALLEVRAKRTITEQAEEFLRRGRETLLLLLKSLGLDLQPERRRDLAKLLEDSPDHPSVKGYREVIAIRVLLKNASSLGIDVGSQEDLPTLVAKYIAKRSDLRKNKDYSSADRIRSLLANVGIALEDTAHGTTWKRA